jgi:hypothetical protein
MGGPGRLNLAARKTPFVLATFRPSIGSADNVLAFLLRDTAEQGQDAWPVGGGQIHAWAVQHLDEGATVVNADHQGDAVEQASRSPPGCQPDRRAADRAHREVCKFARPTP